jgi:hypothetical protein
MPSNKFRRSFRQKNDSRRLRASPVLEPISKLDACCEPPASGAFGDPFAYIVPRGRSLAREFDEQVTQVFAYFLSARRVRYRTSVVVTDTDSAHGWSKHAVRGNCDTVGA